MFSINKRHEKGSRRKVKGTVRRNACWPALKPFTILWENALEASRTLSWICRASKNRKLTVTGAQIPWPCVYRLGFVFFFFNAKLLKLFFSNNLIFLVILYRNISFDFFLGILHFSTSYPALLYILNAQIAVLSYDPCFSELLFLTHENINTYGSFFFLQQWQKMKINHRSCTIHNRTMFNMS